MIKFKIALCLEMPLYQHGGIEVLVRELIRGLHEEFDLYLVSDDDPTSINDSDIGPFLKGMTRYQPSTPKKQAAASLVAWGKAQKIDLFHFHHGTYGWGSRSMSKSVINKVKSAGFPCVSTNHGAFSLMDFVGEMRPLWFKLAALCVCWPAKLLQVAAVDWEATVSRHDLNAVRRWFFPLRHKFIKIYHSVLDAEEDFNPNKRKIILCLGTIGERKGQQYLADAFGMIAKKHSEWRLVIAGRHASKKIADEMLEAIEKHGVADQVDIMEDVPDSLAKKLLNEASIFAMPSVAEGLGLSLQEAMFYGAACIGSSVGGITDMLEHGHTGLVVPPADPVALAQGLERLILDPDLRTRLGTTGRSSIPLKGMSKQGMWQAHSKLYRQSLAHHQL